MNRGQRISSAVVMGVLAIGLSAYVALVVGEWVGVGVLLGLLGVEAWLLGNKYRADTLSEVIWWISSSHPLVPWLFGAATGAAIAYGWVENPWLVGGILYLEGHFFFQSATVYQNIQKEFDSDEDPVE